MGLFSFGKGGLFGGGFDPKELQEKIARAQMLLGSGQPDGMGEANPWMMVPQQQGGHSPFHGLGMALGLHHHRDPLADPALKKKMRDFSPLSPFGGGFASYGGLGGLYPKKGY